MFDCYDLTGRLFLKKCLGCDWLCGSRVLSDLDRPKLVIAIGILCPVNVCAVLFSGSGKIIGRIVRELEFVVASGCDEVDRGVCFISADGIYVAVPKRASAIDIQSETLTDNGFHIGVGEGGGDAPLLLVGAAVFPDGDILIIGEHSDVVAVNVQTFIRQLVYDLVICHSLIPPG